MKLTLKKRIELRDAALAEIASFRQKLADSIAHHRPTRSDTPKPSATRSRPALPVTTSPAPVRIPDQSEPEKLKAYLSALRHRDEFDVMFDLPRNFGPVPADSDPQKLRQFLDELRRREECERIPSPVQRMFQLPVMVGH